MSQDTEKKKEKKHASTMLPAHTTSLHRYLAEISNYPVLSREEEYNLAKKFKDDGDLDAARKLVTSNLKFVVRVANEYKNYGFNTMDIIQEGNVGLMHAVKGFDPTKGYRLISYAVWWIRAYIQNYIIKSWSLVKVGTTQAQRKLFYKLRSTKKELEMGGDNLSSEDYRELAQKLDVPDEAVIEMEQRMGSKDLSLDAEPTSEKGRVSPRLPDRRGSQSGRAPDESRGGRKCQEGNGRRSQNTQGQREVHNREARIVRSAPDARRARNQIQYLKGKSQADRKRSTQEDQRRTGRKGNK